MTVKIKAVSLLLTPALNQFIEDKIGSLERHLHTFDREGAVIVSVEVGRTTRHHRKGDVFRAEVNVKLPGTILRAESEKEDLRLAVSEVKKELKREIEKYRTRTTDTKRQL